MSRRKWNTWGRRFRKELTKTGGLVGLAGLGITAAGATIAGPIILAIGGVTVGGVLVYAGCRGIPPKMISPKSLMGTDLSLEMLKNLDPPILKLGIVGYTQSGKTTFLRQAIQQPTEKERTSNVYAAVYTLQTLPDTYVALLDGDGEQLAQQFEVSENADFLLVFLDHNYGDDKTAKSKNRIDEHDRFLRQLEYHIRRRNPLKRLHIVLNKRDLWEKSKNADELKGWFLEHVEQWKRGEIAENITSDLHSNLYANDIGKIIRHISEQAGTL